MKEEASIPEHDEQFKDVPFCGLEASLADGQSKLDATKIAQFFVPEWNDDNSSTAELKGGITNRLYQVDGPGHDRVLVRIFGLNTHKFINRRHELTLFRFLSKLDRGHARLVGRFVNGVAYSFIEGTVLDYHAISIPKYSKMIAEELAFFHQLDLDGDEKRSDLWDQLDNYESLLPTKKDLTPDQGEKLDSIGLEWVSSELKVLRAMCERVQSPPVLCHNDLLARNVVVMPNKDDECRFIDLEYSFYNHRGFEFGNHFCEFAGYDCNWDCFPSESQQKFFIRAYLKRLLNRVPIDHEVQVLFLEAQPFVLASHFFWGMWALVKSRYAVGSTFDYVKYAEERFMEYKKQKSDLYSKGLLPSE